MNDTPLALRAFRVQPTPRELSPIFPIIPASVIMPIVRLLGVLIVSLRRLADWLVSQSQFWVRREWVGDLWYMAVQPVGISRLVCRCFFPYMRDIDKEVFRNDTTHHHRKHQKQFHSSHS